MALRILQLAAGVLFAALLGIPVWQGLRDGKLYKANRTVTRKSDPIFYWTMIVMGTGWAIFAVCVCAAMALFGEK